MSVNPKKQENKGSGKKIAFLDRDGVINKKAPPHEYITGISDFHFNPGIFEMLGDLKEKGFEFIVITNQRGIARNIISKKTLDDVHAFMSDGLARHGIAILDVLYCPHDENSCDCRKPKPGLLSMACARYSIDLAASILITDSPEEVTMGEKFGVGRNYLIPVDAPRSIA